jgi:hypothetical protein
MLLFVVDKRGKKRLLSLQEAIALMVRGSPLYWNSNESVFVQFSNT